MCGFAFGVDIWHHYRRRILSRQASSPLLMVGSLERGPLRRGLGRRVISSPQTVIDHQWLATSVLGHVHVLMGSRSLLAALTVQVAGVLIVGAVVGGVGTLARGVAPRALLSTDFVPFTRRAVAAA